MQKPAKPMQITSIPIGDLKPAKYNPRKISDEVLDKLIASIKDHGMVEPIVCNKDFTVIGGHQRLKAAAALGMTDIPCIVLDVTPADERRLNIRLNKITGEFDKQMLSSLLIELKELKIDLPALGFTLPELEEFLPSPEIIGEISLPDGEKSEIGQMTFTLSEAQKEQVERAIKLAKSIAGEFDKAANQNSNGNALAFICETFLNQNEPN